MKFGHLMPLLILPVLFLAGNAPGQDMREAFRKAEAERLEQDRRAAEVEQDILNDQEKLTAEVRRLEAQQARLEQVLAEVDAHIATQQAKSEKLEDRWAASELDFREISGNVRLAARDAEAMLHQSLFTPFIPERLEAVSPLLDKGYFPDIDDIRGLAQSLFDEIRLSGQVGLRQGTFTGRDGREASGRILTLGKFTSAYDDGQEIGFLNFSAEAGRYVALAELPSGKFGRALNRYLAGESGDVPLDLSGGNAVNQITHRIDLGEQIQAGGPLVWPILGLAALALFIVVTRVFFLNRIHANTDQFMGELNDLVAQGDWPAAQKYVTEHKRQNSPVMAVIRAGLSVRNADRETQESVLQESILHQLPRIERGLSLLAVMGAVAPLLGLLGTVTGMINTFRVITLFGTGDPKLMSGGISEALITTELGLAVAIPIMLLHTFLSRRSEHIIGDMEEKAVQMTNILQKQRHAKYALAAEA